MVGGARALEGGAVEGGVMEGGVRRGSRIGAVEGGAV